jgi:hypothetical protein
MFFVAGVAQLVERNLAKVEVESSRLFSRSNESSKKKWGGLVNILLRFLFLTLMFHTSHSWRGGRVVMQRPAKPSTPVRFRPPPPNFNRPASSSKSSCLASQASLLRIPLSIATI